MRNSTARLIAIGLIAAAASAPALAMTDKPSEPPTSSSSGGTDVPEPSAIAMFAFGLAGYGASIAARRRRRK